MLNRTADYAVKRNYKMASVAVGENSENVRSEVRNFVVDIQRRLERGNNDVDGLDYIIFRLDWVINTLIRYTCDENVLTESDSGDLQRVTDLLRQVKDSLVIECSDTCTAYRAERVFSGTYGRPKFNIPREQLQFLLEQGFTVPAIANILGVSSRTIERRLSENRLSRRSLYSTISDHDLDAIMTSILTEFPETGYKRMTGFLRARGVVVQQNRIRERMRTINPEGTLLRALRIHAITRRSYQVASPLALWHIDGNHKLIR